MTPEASVESFRMASAALSIDELLRRVKRIVGKADYSIVVPMHPEQGYVSLMSLLFFVFIFVFLFLILTLPSRPLYRGFGLPDRLTLGPRGRDDQGGVWAGGLGEEEEERRGEEADPQKYAGP
jgi:hypothetical protein